MDLAIDFEYCPVVNFAMQQNRVPVVRKLLLKNEGEVAIENVKLVVSLSPGFCETEDYVVDTILPGTVIEVKDVVLDFSAEELSALTEKVNAEICLVILRDNEEVDKKEFPIDILPFDYWAGGRILPEMLSAFVTPNYPAIAALVHRASHFLKQWTGDPSFDAYQSRNPDRVKKQMAALYEAIAELGIVYCTPPASFEVFGQRIRTCDNVLATKLGTCIDMALLYASCLEAVGINPILVLIRGHAFSGAWLVDDTFADSVNDDVSLLTKRLAPGIHEVAFVETTGMNSSGKEIEFDLAMKVAEDHLNDTSRFELLVDVKRCRFVAIRPLPLRVHGDQGWTIIEDEPIIRSGEAPEDVKVDSRVIDIQPTKISKQQLWERKLLDLSLRNNLLNVRLTRTTLQLISTHIHLLEDALSDGDEFSILPKPADWDNGVMEAGIYQTLKQTDPIIDLVKQELTQKRLRSILGENDLNSALTYLYRSSRLSLEENGANTLYLALGMLKWFETPRSEMPRYAPILLLPVEIVRKSAQKGYVIRSRDEEVMANVTLLEMLKQDFNLDIGGLEVLPRDHSGVDVRLVLNTLRKGIMGMPRWNVEESAILGIFSFSKFIMWNDIHNNTETLCENRIVQSLVSGKLEWVEEDGADIHLDEEVKPADLALPISADSFQKEAVCEAALNRSFILHGPPGTGKSQTITNIIADSLYRGKKVLFVAEKMAALSVVQKRLNDIGLSPFCLELHSNKSKKSAVLEQLKATTELIRRNAPEYYEAESEKLHTLRGDLRQYVDLLHQKQASGMSLYDALYRYSLEEDNPCSFEFPSETIATLTATQLEEWMDFAEQMQVCIDLCGSVSTHPLREVQTGNYSLSLKADVGTLLQNRCDLLKNFKKQVDEVCSLMGSMVPCTDLTSLLTLQDLAGFLMQEPDLVGSMLKSEDLPGVLGMVRSVVEHGRIRDRISNEILSRFGKEVLAIEAARILGDWNGAQLKWFLPKFLSEKKLLKSLSLYSLKGGVDKEELVPLLTAITQYQEEKRIVDDFGARLEEILGCLWEDWDGAESACKDCETCSSKLLQWARDVALSVKVRVTFAGQLAEGMGAFLSIHKEKLESLQSKWDELSRLQSQLLEKLGMEFGVTSENWIDNDLNMSQRILLNLDSLRDWCSWNQIRLRASEAGLQEFVDYVAEHGVDHVAGALEKAVCKGVINLTTGTQPILASFNGRIFEDKIRKFREMAKRFEQLTRDEVFARLAANIPSFVREASQSSEVGILQRNIRNGGRGTSIRKLFDLIPSLLPRLAPCMLMSPISVAQYLDARNVKFDLVIFDEASQVPTCESVGAIARGMQAIVVGDPKQMPPTSFFSTNNVDEENLDKEDMESILDDCLALSMSSKHLLWHYRSKHESLIAFSNSQYYDNSLLTFPSPDDLGSKVTYQFVDGFYDKGKSRQNKAEAEAVVREIMARLAHPAQSRRSMGVVTFSSVQQTLIEDLLNEAYAKHPRLEKRALESSEPLFVKNLENVQGDERDVIFFSVGYGPDKDGKVSLNFGPLNRDGGWRRLNVAVSRARYEMKIFSTLKADQIDLSRTSAEGVAGLKSFLEYAEKGKETMAFSNHNAIVKARSLVDVIAAKIRERGYDVHTNIGCSGYRIDIGVVHPEQKGEYILGVLCDGANYREAKTVRDREIIQLDVLHLLGWNIHRVWTMDWLENAEVVLEGIVKAIEEVPEKVEEEPEPMIDEADFLPEEVVSPALPDYKQDYIACPVTFCGVSPDEFTFPARSGLIRDQIEAVLKVEAPISRGQLCRRVLSMWGISRIGSRIDDCFSNLFSSMKLISSGFGKECFYWRSDQIPMELMNYRPSFMSADDICPEEVSVAVKEVLETQIGLSKEDLVRETAKLLGFARMGTLVEASMRRGIDMAILRGFAREEDERIVLHD